ncbi:antibiotic biosynthesis monooxygenase [Streptomyces erythrochromogenes]|uniref:antibiotic biosynthesis monooxygenase n=1 Tax=Streptomyces erythrochromogenes TaxID=285574 RepID=UPI0036FA88B2
MTNDIQAVRKPTLRPTDRAGSADAILLIERAVQPGHEESFRQWAQEILGVAAATPGHLGSGLFHPAEDGQPWIVVQRFQDNTTLQDWLNSPQRAAFSTHSEDRYHAETARRELTGMATWLPDPDRKAAAPPRWRIAVSSGIAIFPISLLGNGVLGPYLAGLPLVGRTAVFTVLFSALMTYIAIPGVSRLLRRWLRPTVPVVDAPPAWRLRPRWMRAGVRRRGSAR